MQFQAANLREFMAEFQRQLFGHHGHLRVVLFNKELDQDTKSLDRIEGVEKKPLMLHRTPERLNHRVGKANIDLRENSVQASSEQSGIHRGVDVLDARIDVEARSPSLSALRPPSS
jgi:hypothetical protein